MSGLGTSKASGSVFAIGTKKVIFTVCDAASNTSTGGFTVTVTNLEAVVTSGTVTRGTVTESDDHYYSSLPDLGAPEGNGDLSCAGSRWRRVWESAVSVTVSASNRMTVQSLAGFQSTFLVDRSKGVFTGSVVDLVTKQKTRLKGVVPQSQEKVLGFYVKDTGVGNWSLLPVSLPR